MEKRYISESRYTKNGSRKRRNVADVKQKTRIKNISKPSANKKIKRKKKDKSFNVIFCIILLILIAIISRAILKDDSEPFIPNIFASNENEDIITIGVITKESLLDDNSLVSLELDRYFKSALLYIDEDYSLSYNILASVEKISGKEYLLSINKSKGVKAEEIINTLKSIGKDSPYYMNVKNIKSMEMIEDKIKVKLSSEDHYFMYKLEIPIKSANYSLATSSNSVKLTYVRNKSTDKSLPKTIVIKRYKDMYEAVSAYKQNDIDMFVTNSENVTNMLGKYEYNIKTFRNGNAEFLVMNSKSAICSRLEVRKAVAYSIDRDSIIKDILKLKGEKIDLPYIYDNVKYKYDIYASENLLLTNGYHKNKEGVYTKNDNGSEVTLSLNLIVNKADTTKINIANKIKNNLAAVGINVNIQKLTESELKSRVSNGKYDLLLSDVTLNLFPDISFLDKYLVKTEDLESAMETQDINGIQKALSDNVSIIGIYSDVSYLVYSKNMVNSEALSYLNVFNWIFK